MRLHLAFYSVFAFLFISSLFAPNTYAGLVINFTGSTGNASADAGFDKAAQYIKTQFTDNTTLTIQRGFANLGSGILGQAGSAAFRTSYTNFRNQMIADKTSSDDAKMTSKLPGGSSYSVYLNHTSENGNSATPYVDNNNSTNNTTVEITTGNARALGFAVAAGIDATITFSNAFDWDFDNSNGIDAGKQDFVGVAIHELMHAMGFVSGVDDIDSSPGLSENRYFAASLDFARFSNASLEAGANIDLTADARDKFFSIDGGSTNLTPGAGGGFSTGVRFGDRRQASHWKDNRGLGIMDPTANPAGQVNLVSELDLRALDVIGWNRFSAVPEPSSLVLASIGGGLALRFRRRLQRLAHSK